MRSRHRRALATALALSLLLAWPSTAGAQGPPSTQRDGRFDAPDAPGDFDARHLAIAIGSPSAAQERAARALDAVVRWDGLTGMPQTVLRYGDALTGPAARPFDPVEVAREFVGANAALWRLDAATLMGMGVVSVVSSPGEAATHVWLQQTVADRPVFGGVLGVTVDRKGRVVWAGGPLWPMVGQPGPGLMDAAAATVAARAAVNADTDADVDPPTRVIFPLPGASGRPAWSTVVHVDDRHVYDTVVDADTGVVLYRVNRVRHNHQAQGTVFREQHPQAPGATRQVTSFEGASFNDAGWVADRQTAGNNAIAFHDTNGDGSSDHIPTTATAPDAGFQHFDYPWTNAITSSGGTDVTTDRDAVITQGFYYTNLAHDRYYRHGFDEASGNFQSDNFGRGGNGGDRVIVRVDNNANGGACCNASFGTPPDGGSPTMILMVEKVGDGTYGHGALDGETVIHEYGHGLHSRLVNGGLGNGSGAQTGGLGEGWGDALAFGVFGDPVLFEYVTTDKVTGLRSVAYDTSGLRYSDLCSGGCQVHSDGEVWATALWDVRAHLIARRGGAAGNDRFEALVVDGMKNTPVSPTFLDARDGILTSGASLHDDADMCGIWNAFAINGMGSSASSPTQTSVVEGAGVPTGCDPTAAITAPATIDEGMPLTLGSASTPGSHASTGALTLAWDLDGDGVFDDGAAPSPTVGPFNDNGPRTFGLQVTNESGRTHEAQVTVQVNNVAPVGSFDVVPAPVVDEGTVGRVLVSFSDRGWADTYTATIDWGEGASSVPVSITDGGPGIPDRGTIEAEIAFADDGTRLMTVVVTDDDGGTLTLHHTVEVHNVAPTVHVSEASTEEGGTATVDLTVDDPGTLDTFDVLIDWGDGPPELVSLGSSATGTQLITRDRTYDDDNPTATPMDEYTVAVTVNDDDGGEGIATSTVQVTNLAPVITSITTSATMDSRAAEGEPVTVTAAFSDTGIRDTHTVRVDWGDGTVTPATVDQTGGAGTAAASHAYSNGGVYPVTVVLTDDDTGTHTATAQVVVVGVGVLGGQLQIVGTDDDDDVRVDDERGQIEVKTDFDHKKQTFAGSTITSVLVLTFDGDDKIDLRSDVQLPADIDVGAGDDQVKAGDGPSTIRGGDGEDRLEGGAAADVIHGGEGEDDIKGREGGDFLAGDAGKDKIDGGDGDDHLEGGDDDDHLDGRKGADTEDGGPGADRCKGKAHDGDVLVACES